MLKIESLRRAWQDFALDVDLALGDAKIGAVLGPSGSGKSSLLRMIAGLERPDAGHIILDGKEICGLPPERRGIGMVFQDFALFPAMTVAGNIAYGPTVAGTPRPERRRIARDLAVSMGIEGLLNRYPASLSGGERQRVALARTLAASPSLVLLDEPLSSLDGNLRRRLRTEVASKLRESGAAALHVTHDVEEAMAIADTIFLMRDGRIEASDDPERIFSDPPSAWAAAFMASGPVIPVLSVVGASDAPVVRTSFGLIACVDSSRFSPSCVSCSVFFPSDSGRLEPPSYAQTGDIDTVPEINRFTCKVHAVYSIGRTRRIILSPLACPIGLKLEMDFSSSSVRPARGDLVDLVLPRSSCRLLPGTPLDDQVNS